MSTQRSQLFASGHSHAINLLTSTTFFQNSFKLTFFFKSSKVLQRSNFFFVSNFFLLRYVASAICCCFIGLHSSSLLDRVVGVEADKYKG